ncbi:trypsin, alkaline C-like [Anopheles aquasalis]|uniref:trypsin, alkaline C-like n=1 Tax=Anopheles aquasalis TaxID=42839 RepID=UPI00215A448D|nr:trypsin, alkaline C-like [Anopheles aquasalis]
MNVIAIVLGLVLIGVAVTDGQERLAGGSKAAVENYPFAAAILYGGRLFGNGAVLGRFFVLTSASALHVTETSGYSVTVGVSNYLQTQMRIQVMQIYRHPEWIGWDDNLAMLATVTIEFSNHIQPIPLAPYSPDDTMLTFVSFGMNSAGTSVQLQHAAFRAMTGSLCHKFLRDGLAAGPINTQRGYCMVTNDSVKKGFFADDSGAPGVSNSQLHAIFAFTTAGGGVEDIGIAMRVPIYKGWIEGTIQRILNS